MCPNAKVYAVRTQSSALKLMESREHVPRSRDTTELPDGTKLGMFWNDCRQNRRCGRQPYDRLLANPVLIADYRTTRNVRATTGPRRKMASPSVYFLLFTILKVFKNPL